MLDQIKKYWQIVAIIFIFGSSWATTSYQVKELERRIDKLEKTIEDIPQMKADLKSLTRDSWKKTR